MSRIGKEAVVIPEGIQVTVADSKVSVKGPKGALELVVHPAIQVCVDDNKVVLAPVVDNQESKKFHGLSRTLVFNMIQGAHTGYKKSLSLVGVGYRAAKDGDGLTLTLGYSHPIAFKALPGVSLNVEKLTTIHVEGVSKEDVGETAARIRRLRPPEPYHGKGVRYADEVIVTKAGKAAKK